MASKGLAFFHPAESRPLSFETHLRVARSALLCKLAAPMPPRRGKRSNPITEGGPTRGSGFVAFRAVRDTTLLVARAWDCDHDRAHGPFRFSEKPNELSARLKPSSRRASIC